MSPPSLFADEGVTDAGLRRLRGLKNLEHLNVEDTAVTAAAELRAHLARLRVVGIPN